jgi:hypothetical protein
MGAPACSGPVGAAGVVVGAAADVVVVVDWWPGEVGDGVGDPPELQAASTNGATASATTNPNCRR